jgi:uncharacterized protein (DUF433 family)
VAFVVLYGNYTEKSLRDEGEFARAYLSEAPIQPLRTKPVETIFQRRFWRALMETRRSTSAAVVSDEEILGGVPVVKGTRIPADTVLAEVRTGKSRFDIYRSYPSLPVDGIDACLAWAKAGRPACATHS